MLLKSENLEDFYCDARNPRRLLFARATTINSGATLIQAKNHKSKSGNESTVSKAEPDTSDASAALGRLDLIAVKTRDFPGRIVISRSVTPRV